MKQKLITIEINKHTLEGDGEVISQLKITTHHQTGNNKPASISCYVCDAPLVIYCALSTKFNTAARGTTLDVNNIKISIELDDNNKNYKGMLKETNRTIGFLKKFVKFHQKEQTNNNNTNYPSNDDLIDVVVNNKSCESCFNKAKVNMSRLIFSDLNDMDPTPLETNHSVQNNHPSANNQSSFWNTIATKLKSCCCPLPSKFHLDSEEEEELLGDDTNNFSYQ